MISTPRLGVRGAAALSPCQTPIRNPKRNQVYTYVHDKLSEMEIGKREHRKAENFQSQTMQRPGQKCDLKETISPFHYSPSSGISGRYK